MCIKKDKYFRPKGTVKLIDIDIDKCKYLVHSARGDALQSSDNIASQVFFLLLFFYG